MEELLVWIFYFILSARPSYCSFSPIFSPKVPSRKRQIASTTSTTTTTTTSNHIEILGMKASDGSSDENGNRRPEWLKQVEFRPANSNDVSQCFEIESASYPADEAASKQSLEYRQKRANPYFRCAVLDSNVIGFVCATRCGEFIAESMSTHSPTGALLAIHSVVVAEKYRRFGLASIMLQDYVAAVKEMRDDGVQNIVLLAKSHLLGFYVNCGFTVTRPSPIAHGKDLWYELEMDVRLDKISSACFEGKGANHAGLQDNIIHSPFLFDGIKNDSDVSNEQKQATIALVILNSPIQSPPGPFFQRLWELASFRVCADGGANRLYDATVTSIHAQSKKKNEYVPELIRGDLDSLRSDVREYYKSKGCAIERDPDQNTNDLDKALQAIVIRSCNSNYENVWVYIYGAFGGRFDQEMGSIQALYKWRTKFNNKIFLYNDETCAFILAPSVRNEIRLPFYGEEHHRTTEEESDAKKRNGVFTFGEGPTCGLIPIGCKCNYVHTTGLKWNLDGNVPLEFGGLVSTSNHANEKSVVVRCSEPLIFTAEISKMSTSTL